MLYDQTTSRGYERVHQPVLRSSLATPNLDHEELKLGQLAAVFSELSHVVSRTGPQRAWLSQILPVSKIAKGRLVLRGFESLPLR
jgi:hypothetical protein